VRSMESQKIVQFSRIFFFKRYPFGLHLEKIAVSALNFENHTPKELWFSKPHARKFCNGKPKPHAKHM